MGVYVGDVRGKDDFNLFFLVTDLVSGAVGVYGGDFNLFFLVLFLSHSSDDVESGLAAEAGAGAGREVFLSTACGTDVLSALTGRDLFLSTASGICILSAGAARDGGGGTGAEYSFVGDAYGGTCW